MRCDRAEMLSETLFALAGALSTLLGQSVGFWVVGLVFMALLLTIAYTDSLWKQCDRSITSEAAFVVTLSPC